MDKEIINTNDIYGLLPFDIGGFDGLVKLALDMRWSWNHSADEIWRQLEPSLWELTNNPWIVLQTVSRDRLKELLADSSFRTRVDQLNEQRTRAQTDAAWFEKTHPGSPLSCVAYFSMEFMLTEALPIYVGGLGNVAGDQLKAASDLGVPVVAIGLLYQQGYFRQQLDFSGSQQALFPYNDPGQLPIMPLRLPNGEWLRVKVDLSNYTVWLRTWQVQVGKTKLYLLDSNDAANLPFHRGITSELYGGGADMRIQQEIILGIGGWKLLRAINIKPEVCHMNEGHAAFLVLERANDYMKQAGISFEEALAVTRAGNLFTTHTAVAAGFDHFNPSLMWQFFGSYAKDELNIDFNNLLALGRENPHNSTESFNMAFLAIRGSGAVNAVSHLHGYVSRQLFQNLFPRWPEDEVPVGYVTNGVHMPTWDSEIADKVWTEACGKNRWRGELETLEHDISSIQVETLWQLRNISRENLVNYVRKRFEGQITVSGDSPELVDVARNIFNPYTLTLGFARRFVPYKRPNLLLHDPERFIRLLTNPDRPVQLVIAGKAPPFDESGKALIRQWVEFIRLHNLYHHVVFLSDYDMLLTERLVQGVDVWVNTPRRPWEACGTSGMKVLVNGGINLSELDGWWAEAYNNEVGWAIGDAREHGHDPAWDAREADALYRILEEQVVPEFYTRNEKGIPEKWIEKMQNSMAKLTPKFSANRTVREYTEKYYLPGAKKYLQRATNKGARGISIVSSKHDVENKWNAIRFGTVKSESTENSHTFEATIFLNGVDGNKVLVELYANAKDAGGPERIKMNVKSSAVGKEIFFANVNTTRPSNDYTVRIIPNYDDISVPLESNLILWQR